MKQTNFLKSFFLLFALIVGSSSVWAETVTYTVTSTSAVSKSGTAPTGSSASYSSTYGTVYQLTKNNSMTLTLSGYAGYRITNITLSMKSNGSSGSGNLSYSTDNGSTYTDIISTAAFSNSSWYGSWSTSYVDISKDVTIIPTSSALKIKIAATANSLYCQSFKITYEATKTLDHISVTTPPTKTAYKIGEPVDLTDMVVTATYTDKSTENVTSKCTFNPASGATLDSSGDQNIAISYSGKNTTQAITVASVTGLAVKTAPTTVKYRIGDDLDLTGLVLTATYSDEGTKDITDFTASPADGSALNTSGNVDVTLSYYGQNCTQRVTVGNLSSITYNATGVGAFANTTYTEKDTFNPEGLVITAHFDNDLDVEASGYTLSPTTETELATSDKKITVSYTWNEVNKTVDIPITVNAGAKYTVSFDAGNGAYTGGNITETEYQGGITLPAATIDLDGWVFAGWAAASQTSTQNRPILYLADETFYPTDNVTLYAVYSLDGIDGTKYQRVTELSQATSASNIIIVNNNKAIDDALGSVNAPTETEGKITPSDNIVWALSGNNTDGFELTTTALSTNKKLGISSIPSSAGNVELTVYNTNWIIEEHTGGENLFVLKNTTNPSNVSNVGVLEYTSNRWKYYCVAASTYKTTNNYSKSKLYIPVKTVYNSNPAAAIIQPTVAFEKGNTTLYLDGTTTYTNTASVTGVAKSVTGYKSSDESVATVDASGVVTAVGIGTATITAYLDIELGVHKAAEASYVVTVKNTTTIAGLKALYNAAQSPAKAFAADLTDAVVTYVSGNHAYIQDASGAIYASCGSSLTAGKKINGAVSGTITAPNTIDEIKTIDISAATVTEDGVIPAAAVKTLAEIKAGDYDGKLVTVNGATVKTGMNDTTSGGVITDDDNVTTFNIIAPNKLTLNATEEGNFTAFVSIYGGSTYRLNIYDASQFVKTRNVATAQPLAFTEDAIELDEETTAFAEFTGQAVEGAQGTVTYAITGDAIGTVNAETGVVTLNGACGTATITATAAAKEVTVAGVTTPYTETEESYTVTVNPRYTVTFSANGQETEVRQESYGAPVTIPTIAPVGNYEVQGWLDEEIDTPTDTEPVELIVESTYTPTNDITLYAVYAKQTIVPNVEQTSTFTFKKSSGSSPTVDNEGTWTFDAVTFVNSNNCGLNSQSITVTPSANVTSIKEVTVRKTANTWGKSVTLTMTDASSNQIFQVKTGDFTSNLYTSDLTDHQSSSYTFASSGMAYVENIVLTYLAPVLAYADYRTSLTSATVTMTIGPAGFNTWHQPFAAEFIADGDNGKAYYAADVDANQVVNFQQFSENKIPANTGAIIKGEVNAEVSYTILDADVDFSAENLLHGTNTTETITADDDYYYFISGRTKVSEDPLTYEYGFFVPKSLETGSTFTNNANKAYLQVLKTMFGGATSKGLGMSWTDAETNGITNVNSTYTDGHYYNLAGQRVSENYKGVVIINGKKVVRK